MTTTGRRLPTWSNRSPGFQECDEKDVETSMACDAEDCGFQMLNDDVIVTSVQEESDLPTMKRMNTRKTTMKVRVHQTLTHFLRLEVVRTTIRVLSYSTTAAQENRDRIAKKNEGIQCTFPHVIAAALAEWYRYRIVADFVTSSSPVPLKTRRVGQRCTLNLSRAETSSVGVVW
ncbi:uncharacterized protein TNCV_2641391 [Trichonephila clavipes]|nr:uncharacterized protein TNCV_2641391 [Trichonephila clavipes]